LLESTIGYSNFGKISMTTTSLYTAVLDLILATITIDFLSLPVFIVNLDCISLIRLFESRTSDPLFADFATLLYVANYTFES